MTMQAAGNQPVAAADVPASGEPVISVIVAAYGARPRIDAPLLSLRAQDFLEPYEVVVVDSGDDGCSDHVVARYPEVRVVRSAQRLYPGEARNAGVRAARGRYVAFLPDDGIARSDWLRRRVAKHRAGFAVVGGAITNATPRHPVASAAHYLEYASVLPVQSILERQAIPHCLSYERGLVGRLGFFPEGTRTGEDTVFNQRCVESQVPIGFDAGIQLAHRSPTSLVDYLRHQYEHGRGLRQCMVRHGFRWPGGPPGRAGRTTLAWAFGRYPAARWWGAWTRVRRGPTRWALQFLALTPLVAAGLVAMAVGIWGEGRRLGGAPKPIR